MGCESVLEAMSFLDPALVEEADEAPRRRLPRRARTLLIAACLCAALVGTVFAAEALWGVYVRETTDNRIQYLLEGMTTFQEEEIGADVRNALAARPDGDYYAKLVYLNWQEAAEHLGLPLAENSLLSAAQAEYPLRTWCQVTSYENVKTGRLSFVVVDTEYLVEGANVKVKALLFVESVEGKTVKELWEGWNEDVEIETERYTMPDGSEGFTAEVCSVEGNAVWYQGVFLKEGILYEVSIKDEHGTGKGEYELLERIMAEFE